MPTLGDLLWRVGVTGLDEFQAQMSGVSGIVNKVVGDADKAFRGFDALGGKLKDIGGTLSIGVTAPLAAIGYAAVGAGADMEALTKGLTAVTGSADEATRQLTSLREVAKLPGLGLKEAVEGSINLQALGFSADESQKILVSFGNALATVGRGRDDLNEVIRQLGQLGARGQVTADNLRPIIERVPQVAAIIKREFGAEALSDPAKRFEKLGISSQEFINTLVKELSKLPPVTGGLKNDLENFSDTVQVSLAKLGNALAPFVSQFVSVAAPAIEQLTNAFTSLPEPMQTAIVVIGGLAAAAGPVLFAVGQMISVFGQFGTAIQTASVLAEKFPAVASAMSGSLSVLGTAALVAVAAFAGWKLGEWLDKNVPLMHAFGQEVANLVLKIPGLESAINRLSGLTKYQADVQEQATLNLKKGEEALAKHGVTVDKAGKSQDEYAKAVAAAVKALASSQPATTNAAKATTDHATAAGKSTQEHGKLTSALDAAKRATDDAARATQGGTQALSLKDQAIRAYQISLQQVQSKIRDLEDAERRGYNVSVQLAELRKSEKTLYEGLHPEILRYAEANRQAAESIDDLIAKLPQLEVTAGSAIEKINSSVGDVAKTFPKWKDAAEQGTNDVVKATTAGAPKVKDAWETNMKQVSTIFTDFSKGIVDDLFDGDFSIGKSLDKVGRAFSRLFVEDAMSYVNHFVDKGIKYLLNNLDDLLGKIPGIGSALGSVFGGGASAAGGAIGAAGSAAGGVASAGSGAAGAATSAVSSVVGVVGAVGAVGSMISGIIGNFQNARMEGTLNAIEEGTRYSALYLGGRADGGILGQMFKLVEEVSWGTTNKAVLDVRDYLKSGVEAHLASLDNSAYWSLRKLEDLNMMMPQKLDAVAMAVQNRPALTINVNGYVGDRDALIAEIKRVFAQDVQLQGA